MVPAMLTTFDEAIAWTRDDDGWTGVVPDEWRQGRAAFGGVVAAAALRAMRSLVGALTVRTVTTTFVGPLTGEPARLTARVLRQGRSVTFAAAEIRQGDAVRARVQAVFGAARDSSLHPKRPTVTVPAPDAGIPFPYLPGITPQFIQGIDARWFDGMPFSGSDGDTLAALLRFRVPAARGPERLLGLLDIPPAPVLQQLRGPAPASSVSWTAHLIAEDELADGDFAWFTYDTETTGDGYSTVVGRMYGPDGRMLAWSEQLIAVFG